MRKAHFRFYAELNDFLAPERRQARFSHCFRGHESVKDLIESLGVPHPEVNLILVNGESTDFYYSVQDGDWLSIYPAFTTIDIEPVSRVQPQPLPQARFVLDINLGRLATYLRMLGFDVLYWNDGQDEDLARLSCNEERILLSRDRGLLKRSIVNHGYCVRSTDPQEQLVEVLRRFNLFGAIMPFRRCLSCNSELELVAKDSILERLPPQTRQDYEDFRLCPRCDQIYWQGSHYQRMQQFIEQVLQQQPLQHRLKT
ncbi:Mut7-C RNAse domain-containing protein [Leptolyngbya sp. FACHB-261]|uniref:Mut7-C RNAse domain-containing protein n=1 Tax=Leptolyngbya sp. FACHB-261 TaxID=2692806 RepID=UPI001685D485|nr:Mut7-C RNAse domain-containing protein [Leptolyngbya sp. FACHB-261]MBD2101047.1 Mut7-C ubiquitin/RNAse domain-containing protein [Leptolyngbya sp. FACHB-261]